MVINGSDYTIPIVVMLSLLVLFAAQLLCCKARNRLVRHLPWLWVIAALCVAVAALFGDSGGWIDLREFFATLTAAYAALCAAAIGLAHLVFEMNHKSRR